ncbi:30S ribosomal protein S8 [Patescibacteria group bacterium]|nr:30S ribosomal protein S8 [Patescibacteria group bacterium]
MTDPITDMLNRIRNAQAVSHKTVVIPYSNIKYSIARILEKQGLVGVVEKKGRTIKKTIDVTLKYPSEISGLKRVSKPGQRIYAGSKEIKGTKGKYGLVIVSTPKGLMTGKEARRNKVGGEIICEIW